MANGDVAKVVDEYDYTRAEARLAFTVLRLFVLGARKVKADLIREAIKSSARIIAERAERIAGESARVKSERARGYARRRRKQEEAMGRTLRFTIPFVPMSKKNATRIMRGKNGKSYPGKTAEAKRQEQEIGLLALAAMKRDGVKSFGRNAVCAEITWDEEAGKVAVEIIDLGEVKAHPRQDLSNIPALILDALEGIIYDNDRSVAQLVAARMFGHRRKGRQTR